MLGDIHDHRVIDTITSAFGATAGSLRERANRSAQREADGQRANREDGYTEELIDALGNGVRDRINQAAADIAAAGFRIQVRFEPFNLPVSAEQEFGADLGLTLIVETDGFVSYKGILVQCKRMGSPKKPTFPAIRGDGEAQAIKMLRVTPASVFFLYTSANKKTWSKGLNSRLGCSCPSRAHSCPLRPQGCSKSMIFQRSSGNRVRIRLGTSV